MRSAGPQPRLCLDDNIPSPAQSAGRGSNGPTLTIYWYLTDYASQRLRQRDITTDEVSEAILKSSGRYTRFTFLEHGVERLGFWYKGLFVSTEVDGQGDLMVVNAIRKSQQAVDKRIAGGG